MLRLKPVRVSDRVCTCQPPPVFFPPSSFLSPFQLSFPLQFSFPRVNPLQFSFPLPVIFPPPVFFPPGKANRKVNWAQPRHRKPENQTCLQVLFPELVRASGTSFLHEENAGGSWIHCTALVCRIALLHALDPLSMLFYSPH